MASQADVPSLLSKLIATSLAQAGVPEHEVSQRQVYLLRMTAGILGSSAYARNSVEGGGDDTALLHGLRKDLDASGADKTKLDKLNELCNRLSPGGGRPGLSLRLRTALLLLLRQLHREGRQLGIAGPSGRLAPTFSLTQSLQLGGLPPTYSATIIPAGPNSSQQQQQQQQQQQRPYSGLPRLSSAASVLAAGTVRPTSVVTPSEMGDDVPLSAEVSRMSLMGGGADTEFYIRGVGTAGGPAGRASTDSLLAAVNMAASTEPSLVRDVLYAAQGVRGRVLAWVNEGGGVARDLKSGFRPDPAVASGLGPARSMLIDRLTELGWLFRRVREHISCCTGSDQASVRQALGAALAAEVGDFYRLLALLEAQAGLPIPTPGDPPEGPPGGASGQFLTLRRLLCWLSEPLRRMRLLAAVGDAAEGLEGGALAGVVYEFSLHGDPFVAANAAKLLQQVCVPLYGIIRRWVLEGELHDAYNEFFVVQHAAVGGGAAAVAALPATIVVDLWRQSYGLDESRLPPFIGPSLAQRILRAGKAIHYLNLACGDGGWVQQRAEAWARAPPAAAAVASASGELAGLEGMVSEAVRSVDQRLLTVIWRHHRLRAHFAAIRRFLLLGQGDWVTAFIDLAQRELDKPATDVSEVQLNSCLRQALTATNVLGGAGQGGAAGGGGGISTGRALASGGAFLGPVAAAAAAAALAGDGAGLGLGAEEDADDEGVAMGVLAERLRVRKERAAGAGETGWDVFSLYYNPAAGMPGAAGAPGGPGGAAAGAPAPSSGGPLSALFTPAALMSYNQLARLLWRLKRAEHALSCTWGAAACGLQRMIDKMGADGYLVQPVLAMLLGLRSDMSHFATNLQYYIQFEVMEASWQDFYARAAACADLDSLIAAHEAHLATLLRKALLAHDTAPAGAAAATAAAGEDAANGPLPGSRGGADGAGLTTGPSATALRRALQDALSNMLALRAVASRLEEVVTGGARVAAARASQAKAHVARGGWGVAAPIELGATSEPPIPPAALADIRRTLLELRAQHQRAVADFTENLPEEAQDDVRFLLARLDFSAKGVQAAIGATASGALIMGGVGQ